MNDVLAKPFTKTGLFGILDKHLIHLKAIQMSAEVPRSVGLPPLSDQGVVDAIAMGAMQWMHDESLRNPLAAMGWSDETYQFVLQVNSIDNHSILMNPDRSLLSNSWLLEPCLNMDQLVMELSALVWCLESPLGLIASAHLKYWKTSGARPIHPLRMCMTSSV